MRYISITIIGLLFSTAAYPASNVTQTLSISELNNIDIKHQGFSSHFHALLVQEPQWESAKRQTIKSLEKAVQAHIANGKNLLAANLIIKNLPLLKNNYDHPALLQFIKILLDQNEWNFAVSLFDLIKQHGDQMLVSSTAYIFSIFTFKRNQWEQTLKHLTEIIDDLPPEEYHHALLMKGISLQRLTRHRDAILAYERIPPTSEYYVAARFNLAIANIRQGWWTEGHMIIKNMLNNSEIQKKEESLNRMYLTLGYSFLKQQYFRNARDTFRNISINSKYTHQAMHGIALTAASQEDYVGALSIINILKEARSLDLTVDESYLLTPYFYEKLAQSATASAGYLEATSYYQKRIEGIQTVLHSDIDLGKFTLDASNTFHIDKNPINIASKYPDYLIDNYLMLKRYKTYLEGIDNKALKAEFKQLVAEYETIIIKMIRTILEERIMHLDSYMNQARYGLARLYDNHPGSD